MGKVKIKMERLMEIPVNEVVSSIAIGSVLQPGTVSIVIGTHNGRIYVLDREYNTILTIEKDTPVIDLALGDADGDGIMEIAFVRMGGYVNLISSGKIVMESAMSTKVVTIDAGDIDNDGKDEFVIGGAMILREIKKDGKTRELLHVLHDILTVDISDTIGKKADIVVGMSDGTILLIRDKRKVWQKNMKEMPRAVKFIECDGAHYIIAVGSENMILYDLNGNKIHERKLRSVPSAVGTGPLCGGREDYIAIAGSDNRIYLFNPVKKLHVVHTIEAEDISDITAINIADINNDHVGELLIGTSDGRVIVYENVAASKEYDALERYGKLFIELARKGKATTDELFMAGIPSDMLQKTIEYVREEPTFRDVEHDLWEIDRESKKLSDFKEIPTLDKLVIEKGLSIKLAKELLWLLKHFNEFHLPVHYDQEYEQSIKNLVPLFRKATPLLEIIRKTGKGIVSIRKALDYFANLVVHQQIVIPVGLVREIPASIEKTIDLLISEFEKKKME